MLKAVKQFYDQYIAAAAHQGRSSNEHALQLATAALLFEMMRMDSNISTQEQTLVRKLIEQTFSLNSEEITQLLKLAELEAVESTDYHQFTSLINQHFSAQQKGRIVEHLWQVAYADGHVDKHEEHLVRKIADLIYVPHKTFIAAKHRAAAQR